MPAASREKKRVLSVQMLGGYSVALDGRELKLSGGAGSKTARLFILLAYHGEQGVSRREILDCLYADEDCADDAGNLRVAIFRLKKQLVAAGVLEASDSINAKGVYRLASEGLELSVDIRQFEEAAGKALEPENSQEELLEQACRMYTGEFLPSLSGDMWAVGKQAMYQNLYFTCVRRYLELLASREKYGKMLLTARNVLRLYPYDEWYVAELDALIGMGRWKEAQDTAQRSTESLMERMGLWPSEELEKRILKINSQVQGSFKSLQEIQGELEEKKSEEGAFNCSYDSFMGTYRYEMRKIERTGESLYLVLCSLTEKENDKGSRMSDSQFEKAVRHLEDAVRLSLRRADVYTRYGRNQYLMLLVGLKQEDCAMIFERIQGKFERAVGKKSRFQINQFISPLITRGSKAAESQAPLKFSRSQWN